MRDENVESAADRVGVLAHRLAEVVDLPTAEQITQVLADAGWEADATAAGLRFRAEGLRTWARVERGTASIRVVLADLGCPEDVGEQVYEEAEAIVRLVAERLALPPADELAADVLADHGDRVLLRAGHWAVSVAAVQHDADLPVTVEADLSYGADLPGRLAHLAGPGEHGTPVDWRAASSRIGVELPRDYRWLMEHYGAGTFDGYLSLTSPAQLSKPVFGPPAGTLRYVTYVLPAATTVDGATISWVLEPFESADQWHLQVVSPDTEPWDVHVGLLHFLVITLSGAYRAPQLRSGFPGGAPGFTPA